MLENNKKKENSRNKTFTVLSIFFMCFFLILEFTLRVLMPRHFISSDSIYFNAETFKDYVPDNSFYTFPSKYDKFKPILNKINSIGLRGPEISKKNKYRVLNIGDSYIQADEVLFENTFTSKLNEQKLPIEFISHGIASWSPTLEFAWIYRNYKKLLIDEVNLFLCVNDFFSMENYTGSDEYYRSLANYNEEKVPVSFEIKTQTKSINYFKRFLREFYIVKCILIFKNVLIPQVLSKKAINNKKYIEDLDITKLGQNSSIWSLKLKRNVEETLQVIINLNRFLISKNIKLNILFVPDYWYFKDEARVAKKRTIHPDLILLPTIGIESFTKRLLKKKKINFIDLTNKFMEHKKSSDSKLYYESDAHWNKNGHDIVFEVLYDFYMNEN